MSQALPYAEIKNDFAVSLEKALSTADKVDTGHVFGVELEITARSEKVLLSFPFCPDNKKKQNVNILTT